MFTRNILITTLSLLIILLASCTQDSKEKNKCNGCKRIGAICNDGWRSHSTGSGTCSHHGGVKEWLYENKN